MQHFAVRIFLVGVKFGRFRLFQGHSRTFGLSDFRTFGLSDFRTFGYAFQSSLGMCLSLRLAPASAALEGGEHPNPPPFALNMYL